MKKINLLLVMVLTAVTYSCGNGKQGSNEQKADSLATAKQAEVQASDVDLYKYFSQKEMKSEMDKAVKLFSKNPSNFGQLFVEEGFALSPDALEKKWGTAKKKEVVTPKPDEDEVSSNPYANLEFDQFSISLDNYGKDWNISYLM